MATKITASISAADTFSDIANIEGYFNLSLSGTFSATVTVQRSTDKSTWMDVDSFTAPTQMVGFDPEHMWYRVGIKAGDYTSGTAVVRIGHEDKEEH